MSESNATVWLPTREAALDQLSRFAPRAGKLYSDNRNYDNAIDNHESVSKLSPWLRHRVITEHEVVNAALEVHSEKSADKFIQEVFWRSYWKGWLEMRPQVWHQYQQDVLKLYQDEKYFSEAETVVQFGSGIDCFDHWLQELKDTGYLHNHARMWFASIWIFTLQLPWQLGADFFLQHLLDGDPASNTLSWRWVAGLQTKGKAYAATAENISKFTNNRFNPAGQLNENVQPLTEAVVFEKKEIPQVTSDLPDGRLGLVLHEDDLQPATVGMFGRVQSVVALQATSLLSPGAVRENVSGFSRQCIESAGRRLASDLDVDFHRLLVCEEISDFQDAMGEIIQWAQSENLDAVVWRYAPTGPTASLLKEVCLALTGNGISCTEFSCDWDTTVWPHAGKGFFALKKKIPELLAELG